VGVRKAEKLVESLPRGQKSRMVAQVPFTDGRGMVAQRLEHLGDGCLVGVEAVFGGMIERTVDAQPVGVAPREQGGTGGGTNRLCSVEIRKTNAFCGHFIQMGRLNIGRAEYADILVALVVGKDDDDIGLLLYSPFLCTGDSGRQANGSQQEAYGGDGHVIVVLTESYWYSTANVRNILRKGLCRKSLVGENSLSLGKRRSLMLVRPRLHLYAIHDLCL